MSAQALIQSTGDTCRPISAIGPSLTFHHGVDIGKHRLNLGNDGMGVRNTLLDIGNDDLGLHNTTTNIGIRYIRVYCELSLEAMHLTLRSGRTT